MSTAESLHRIAEAHGIQLRYQGDGGAWRTPSDAAVRAVLAAMGVAPGARIGSRVSEPPREEQVDVRCHLPGWLRRGKCWGVTCQLYGLRSARSCGIGDFEDLAALAEQAGAAGADFLGVSPLHALFTADPARCSPFSPSSRRFLNPFYIALDRIPGVMAAPRIDPEAVKALRLAAEVDYPAVAYLKLGVLRALWRRLTADEALWVPASRAAFDRFIAEGGAALRGHALFEALSHSMVAQGSGAGWSDWPAPLRDADSDEVQRFAAENESELRFHQWLQWIADVQLGAAAARAAAAGMRVGLYLDIAVGAAPDGSATWTDPALVVRNAEIGAPPDAFFHGGQKWGLAPMSPVVLRERAFAPYHDVLDATMRHAGAVRIDHAMGLTRLFWIPTGHPVTDGCYVTYPLATMMRVVANTSVARRVLVIGEDLGTVPEGFSAMMRKANMLSCRVMYFEQTRRGFRAARAFPRNALLSASTHDLPPLAAWWASDDIGLFETLGLIDGAEGERRRANRAKDRRALLAQLRRAAAQRPLSGAVPPDDPAEDGALTPGLAGAIHGWLARTPARLVAVQFEDLCAARAPVNVPGTHLEYPNWRLRAPMTLEEVASGPYWAAIVRAVAAERPRPQT